MPSAAKKVDALVFPEEAAPTGEPQTIAGFPGVFTPGEPVALDELGIETQADAKKLIADGKLPLELVKAEVPKREEPPVAGRHYDPDDLEPGEAIPVMVSAARISSAPEGLELGQKMPPSATPPPLETEIVHEQVAPDAEPEEVA